MPGLDANTKLLLHLNGIDAATSTTDVSPSGHTITFNGTAQIDTAQKKWGNASLLLDGDSDYLSLADSADWDIFGSNADDWTIDLWVKFTDHVGVERIIGQYEAATDHWNLWHNHGTGFGFYLHSGNVTVVNTGYAGEVTDINWHHVAVCKVGSKYAIYVGGTQVNYTDDSDTDTFAGSLYIGRRGDAEGYFDGHLDEIRIQHSNYFGAAPVVGLTDTITVPTRQYGILAQAIIME